MAASVQQYFQAGLAPSTQKSYQAAMRRFYKFCTTYSINTPFPLSEQLLCSYAAFLADQRLASQTIKSYLSALRNLQLTLGLPDPREKSSMPILKRVQAGIRRIRFQKGPPSRIRLPITAHLMKRIKHALDTSLNPEKAAVWAVASTAFFGFFRLGELLLDSAKSFDEKMCLSWGDVAVDDRVAPKMIQVHLKRSKCDQFGSGADVVVGVTGDELCPVAAILDFIELREDKKGPFFLTSSGEVITKTWFIEQIRSILSTIGVPPLQYAGHSFRVGTATTAAMAGVEDSMIQTLGRWHSSAFLQYIRTPKERLAGMSAILVAAERP